MVLQGGRDMDRDHTNEGPGQCFMDITQRVGEILVFAEQGRQGKLAEKCHRMRTLSQWLAIVTSP